MPKLELYLMGPPYVLWDGEPVTILRRQTRALLFRLGTHLLPIARDRLAYQFWADRPQNVARRNLTHLLTHLREALPNDEVITADTDQISLDPDLAWSDTAEFEQRAAVHGSCNIEELETTLRLYRRPFISGFTLGHSTEYDEWAGRNVQLGTATPRSVKELLEAYYDQGRHAEAIKAAHEYHASMKPTKQIHQRLIELYALTGNWAAAVQYQTRLCCARNWASRCWVAHQVSLLGGFGG
ncbi:MAG: hypothetical protein R3A10_11935 [Caldilineaceae bacterium]